MKIGVFGPIFVNLQMESDKPCDLTSSVTGSATLTLGSSYAELAMKLAKDHEVMMFTSLDTSADVAIERILKHSGVNTEYITYERHGTGFNISITESATINSYPSLTHAINQIRLHEDRIFSNLDFMVVSDLEVELINLCKKHDVSIVWLTDAAELESLDEHDHQVLLDAHATAYSNYTKLMEDIA